MRAEDLENSREEAVRPGAELYGGKEGREGEKEGRESAEVHRLSSYECWSVLILVLWRSTPLLRE